MQEASKRYSFITNIYFFDTMQNEEIMRRFFLINKNENANERDLGVDFVYLLS